MADLHNSRWNEVLGPFYAESGLRRHGVEPDEDLIRLHTDQDIAVYPEGQFTRVQIARNYRLDRREPVIKLWNTYIVPAIQEGVVDEWTATGLLLQRPDGRPSQADVIVRDPSQVEHVATNIQRALARFRQ